MNILIRSGAIDEARQAIEIRPTLDRFHHLQVIAATHEQTGDLAAARATRQEALRLGEELLREKLALGPKRSRDTAAMRLDGIAWAAAEVADLQARLGDYPAALRTIASIDAEAQQRALALFASYRAAAGDLETARAMIDCLDSPAARERAWIDVAIALPAPKETATPKP